VGRDVELIASKAPFSPRCNLRLAITAPRLANDHTLAVVVVKRRAGPAQEQSEFVAALEQVAQCLAQAAVGLHQVLLELLCHPVVQVLHDRGAVFLVERQALLG